MERKGNKNLCYKMHRLTRLLQVQLNDQIKPYGVTQGQLPVLCCLWENEGQTQAELCEKIQVEQPTMANTLRRMERDGLVRRAPCEQDKRQSRIFLTELIRPDVLVLETKRDTVIDRMTRLMTAEELEIFHRLLDKAAMALENQE
jgi:MarR family transcriptional regulator for hemolysin